MKNVLTFSRRYAVVIAVMAVNALAMGGGRLASTQAILGLSSEVAGPLAYSLSLVMVVGSAIGWYRHHHDPGAISNGMMGTVLVAGTALGATSLMGMIPGVAGALI